MSSSLSSILWSLSCLRRSYQTDSTHLSIILSNRRRKSTRQPRCLSAFSLAWVGWSRGSTRLIPEESGRALVSAPVHVRVLGGPHSSASGARITSARKPTTSTDFPPNIETLRLGTQVIMTIISAASPVVTGDEVSSNFFVQYSWLGLVLGAGLIIAGLIMAMSLNTQGG